MMGTSDAHKHKRFLSAKFVLVTVPTGTGNALAFPSPALTPSYLITPTCDTAFYSSATNVWRRKTRSIIRRVLRSRQ